MMATPEGGASAPSRRDQFVKYLLREPLTLARAAWIIGVATVSATIISGIVIHFTDSGNFPSIGDGLWWAVQTVTTVGYGDHVPTSTTGRFIGAFVMIVGIAFLTVTTASITSVFIEQARRRMEGARSDALSGALEQINERLVAIEAALNQTSKPPAGDA